MDRSQSHKKILVAVRACDTALVFRAIGSEFDVVMCHTYAEALPTLSDHIGVIACGVHFDGGRMFDLLRAATDLPATRAVPFLIGLGDSTQYSPAMLKGIHTAALLLGATDFIDLSKAVREVGEEQAYKQLRHGLRNYLRNQTAPAFAPAPHSLAAEHPQAISADRLSSP